MKILIIFNPAAGAKKFKTRAVIEKVLKEQGVDFDLIETKKDINYFPNSLTGYDRMVAIGGDGTVNAVANWLLKNNFFTPLAIVPTGSANLLAHCLGIPRNAGLALKLAVNGRVKEIDVGVVNHEKYFLVAMGLGYDARVIAETRRSWKKLIGKRAYFFGLLRGLIFWREDNFQLTVDGERIQRHAKTIFVMNFGRFFGFDFGPEIKFNDGRIDLAVVRPVKFRDIFKIFAHLFQKKYYWERRLEYFKGKKIQINFNQKMPVQIDGEAIKLGSPIEIDVGEKKLKVVC